MLKQLVKLLIIFKGLHAGLELPFRHQCPAMQKPVPTALLLVYIQAFIKYYYKLISNR